MIKPLCFLLSLLLLHVVTFGHLRKDSDPNDGTEDKIKEMKFVSKKKKSTLNYTDILDYYRLKWIPLIRIILTVDVLETFRFFVCLFCLWQSTHSIDPTILGVANMVLPICFLIMPFAATLAYWFVFKPEVTILGQQGGALSCQIIPASLVWKVHPFSAKTQTRLYTTRLFGRCCHCGYTCILSLAQIVFTTDDFPATTLRYTNLCQVT